MSELMSNIPVRTTGDMLNYVKMEFMYGTPGEYIPMIFIGKGGIGKSAIIAELVQSLSIELKEKIGYIDLRLINFDAVDTKGVPVPNLEKKVTDWLVNNCYPNTERDGERGILVLDEITSADEQTQTGVYQLLAERKLNNYEFPDGWMIVCLGNGEEDGGTYNVLTPNFVNRCSIFYVESDKDHWLKWARTHGIHEYVLAYINWENSVLHGFDPSIVGLDGTLFPSPRAYAKISHYLSYPTVSQDKADALPQVVQDLILGTIGNTEGNKFLAFLETRKELIDLDTVEKGTAEPLNQAELSDLDKYMSLAIEGLVGRYSKRADKYTSLKGAERTKYREQQENAIVNTVEWLYNSMLREYAIRYLSSILMMGPKNALLMDMILSQGFFEAHPHLAEIMPTNEEL